MEYVSIPIKKQCKTKKSDIEKNNQMYVKADLELSFQKFNPSTSPPENSFMERLQARNISYGEN